MGTGGEATVFPFFFVLGKRAWKEELGMATVADSAWVVRGAAYTTANGSRAHGHLDDLAKFNPLPSKRVFGNRFPLDSTGDPTPYSSLSLGLQMRYRAGVGL